MPGCLSFCYNPEQPTFSLKDVEAQREILLETQMPRCGFSQLLHLLSPCPPIIIISFKNYSDCLFLLHYLFI